MGGAISGPPIIEKAMAMDPIYTYFSQNIESISKEQLLEALGNALKSADFGREACLLGIMPDHFTVRNLD